MHDLPPFKVKMSVSDWVALCLLLAMSLFLLYWLKTALGIDLFAEDTEFHSMLGE